MVEPRPARGDLVTVAIKGHYGGRPRPALVIQSDLYPTTEALTLCPTSTVLQEPLPQYVMRVTIDYHFLDERSQIMVDKIMTVPVRKIGMVIGRLARGDMYMVNEALRVFLGL